MFYVHCIAQLGLSLTLGGRVGFIVFQVIFRTDNIFLIQYIYGLKVQQIRSYGIMWSYDVKVHIHR